MTNKSISAVGVGLPLKVPTGIATRVIRDRHYLVVRITDPSSGIAGYGYTYIGSHGSKSAVTMFEEVFAPLLTNALDLGIAELWESLYTETLLVGRAGIAIRILSAIDIALWDLRSKESGVPLIEFLGGVVSESPSYASGGYYLPKVDSITAIQDEMRYNISQGFSKHKIKVGGMDLEGDAARISAALDVLPDDHLLSIDANNAYSSPNEAARALDRFESAAGDRGLWWFEEPLHPSDVKGHAFLRSRFMTPIATGEILQTRYEVLPYIEEQAADILQIDVGVLGGVSEFMKVAQAADVFGIQIAPHWHANLHVNFEPALANCFVLEHFLLEKDIFNFEQLLVDTSRLKYEHGNVIPSRNAGIGIEFDEQVLVQNATGVYQW